MKAQIDLKLPLIPPELLKGDPAWRQFERALYEFARDVKSAIEESSGQIGTWTPVDASGAGLGFAAALGSYTKIGRLVTAHCYVIYPATASGASAAIGGLPFAISSTYIPIAAVYSTDTTGTTGAVGAVGTTGVALAILAGGAAKTNAQFSGDTVVFTLVYETD